MTRTNSEALLGAMTVRVPAEDLTKGVAITSSFHPDDDTHVENCRYGPGSNAMGLLVSRCEAATFHRAAGLDRSRYWAETRDQLDAADGVPATDYIDAQRYRAVLREEMLAVLREHHVLAMPTAPVLAPPVERADEYLTILSRNAILWSFVGFPAISVPCPTDGLPVGLQLVAGPGGEALLIALATALTKGHA